ncbi:MAG: Gfo/Idh/MocA family oxidoreductase [Victivallales bacterium]|nr:Gfo/Idh/MocA family oxidoreductase [Victivallales bacterium]
MKTYRVGVIGFGYIGKVHAFAHKNLPFFFGNLPFRTKITHVCTSRAESAAAAGEFLEAKGVTDYREITENPDIDVVHICTPNNFHKDAVLSAMAHGKHIYCDKPLTVTLAEAEEIERALPSYKGIHQMTLQLRFFPGTLRAKQLIDEGFIGKPLQFRCSFMHSGNIDQKNPLKWRYSDAAGGGVVADLGSHALDLTTCMLGNIKRLSAMTQLAVSERRSLTDPNVMLPVDCEDAMFSMVELENGAKGTVEATKLATGAEDEIRLEMHGTKGAIRFDSMDPHHLEIYDVRAADSPIGGVRGWTRVDTGQRYDAPSCFPATKSTIGWLRAHVQCLYHFMDCVDRGVKAEPGLEQGVMIQRVMDAVKRSAASGQWIDL